MPIQYSSDVEAVNDLVKKYQKLRDEIGKVIIGQDEVVRDKSQAFALLRINIYNSSEFHRIRFFRLGTGEPDDLVANHPAVLRYGLRMTDVEVKVGLCAGDEIGMGLVNACEPSEINIPTVDNIKGPRFVHD